MQTKYLFFYLFFSLTLTQQCFSMEEKWVSIEIKHLQFITLDEDWEELVFPSQEEDKINSHNNTPPALKQTHHGTLTSNEITQACSLGSQNENTDKTKDEVTQDFEKIRRIMNHKEFSDPNFQKTCQCFAAAVNLPDENTFFNEPQNFLIFLHVRFKNKDISLTPACYIASTAHPLWQKIFTIANLFNINFLAKDKDGNDLLCYAKISGNEALYDRLHQIIQQIKEAGKETRHTNHISELLRAMRIGGLAGYSS